MENKFVELLKEDEGLKLFMRLKVLNNAFLGTSSRNNILSRKNIVNVYMLERYIDPEIDYCFKLERCINPAVLFFKRVQCSEEIVKSLGFDNEREYVKSYFDRFAIWVKEYRDYFNLHCLDSREMIVFLFLIYYEYAKPRKVMELKTLVTGYTKDNLWWSKKESIIVDSFISIEMKTNRIENSKLYYPDCGKLMPTVRAVLGV